MTRRKMTRKKTIDMKAIGEKTAFEKITCRAHENALLLAAASSEPDAKLARHLAHCSACRGTLLAKQELFARIEAVLRAQMQEDPGPDFLPQLRLKLSREPAAQPITNRPLNVAGAALALVLIAMLFPLVSTRHWGVRRNLQTPAIATRSSAGVTQSVLAAADPGARPRPHYKHPAVQTAPPREPDVLVPPDEREAFARFVALAAGHDAVAEAVVSPAADNPVVRNTELPQVASVDMAALQFNFNGAE